MDYKKIIPAIDNLATNILKYVSGMFNKKSFPYPHHLIKEIVLCAACLLFTSLHVFAQENVKAITASFNKYQENTIKEKIFIHTDKSIYQAGEIIWMKLYNTDASFHKPIDISKVAYAEILDTLNKPVLQAKIALTKGAGSGSFYLPQSIPSGNYKLRAYTNWMKNSDAGYFFEKNITIINLQKTAGISILDSIGKYNISFFPEGGDLINGLQSKVAFKAIDQNGTGFNFTGYLLDKNDTVLQLRPQHEGMGNFIFTPATDHTYKAIIITDGGKSFTKELPLVYATGYTMQVTDADTDKINITVATNVPSAAQVYLFVHTRGSVKVAMSAQVTNGKAVFSFSRYLAGDGISHCTIFNDQKKPVCERLYFKRPAQILQLNVNSDQAVYNIRSKVTIDIASAQATMNDTANLSMSVYRLDSLQSLDNNTIETYLLLSSDVRGVIENPQYYFTSTDNSAGIAADNLMLTNGWRRFTWNDILQNKKPLFEFVPEYNGHIITGNVVNTKTNEAQKYAEIFLSVPGSMTQFRSSVSDINGHVKFEMKNFYGGSVIIAQTNTFNDSTSRIEINDPFSKNFSTNAIPAFKKLAGFPATVLNQNISMQVQNIYAADKLKQFSFPAADSASFYVNPDLTYALDDYTRFTSLEEVLREYVALVNVARRNGRVYMPVVNVPNNAFFQTDPLVLIDGVPVFNFNKLLEFDPLKLKSLEVVTRRYLMGNSVFEGILNWKTYGANLSNYEFAPNALVLDYEGLQLEREFYAPSYDNAAALASHLPDFRNVLQWSPDIQLHGSVKKPVSFYTSDLPGKYAVVVQGITSTGICGSKVIMFEVKK